MNYAETVKKSAQTVINESKGATFRLLLKWVINLTSREFYAYICQTKTLRLPQDSFPLSQAKALLRPSRKQYRCFGSIKAAFLWLIVKKPPSQQAKRSFRREKYYPTVETPFIRNKLAFPQCIIEQCGRIFQDVADFRGIQQPFPRHAKTSCGLAACK